MPRGSHRRVGCTALALALCSMLAACERSAPVRTLDRIEPDEAPNDAPAQVVLYGDGFLQTPRVQLSSRERAALRNDYHVAFQGSDFETGDVEVRSSQLGFTVPMDLEPMRYDVVVIPPSGERLILKNGFRVVPGAQPAGHRLTLETKEDSGGEYSLPVGTSIELYAVLRDARGGLVSEEEVVSFSQEVVLGELSETYAAHTRFDARVPGETVIVGVSEVLGLSGSARLRVTGELSDLVLSIEDAAGGAGKAFAPNLSLRSSEQLSMHAVVRDLGGAFVLDVPASWEVAGQQAVSVGESLTLAWERVGEATIVARYLELDPALLTVRVGAGRAASLTLAPGGPISLRAGESPLQFVVTAEDELGHATDDLGTLTWTIRDGEFGDFSTEDQRLTPRRAGTGRLRVESSHGPSVTSGPVEVRPGPLARLAVVPNALTVSADDAPIQFEVEGYDAFDNRTDDLGTLSWSANGGIGALSELGELDPMAAGSGTIAVTSSLGPTATSGAIEITAGALTTLSVQPQTWSGKVGDAPQQFTGTGSDADGNVVADIGTLSFRVASGSIGEIDAQSGLFTPTLSGQGTIEVTSSYGLSGVSQSVVVSPLGAGLQIAAIRAPSFFWQGERGARIEVDVTSTDMSEVPFSGVGLGFSSWRGDQTAHFTVVPDHNNSDRVPAGGTRTLVYYVDTDEDLSTSASITISASGEAFPGLGPPFAFARSVSTDTQRALVEPTLQLTAPVAPANRVCAGGQVSFAAQTSNLFSPDYLWRIPGSSFATGSSATNRTPTAAFPTVGNFSYSVTATYFGYPNTLFGAPVYVGSAAAQPTDTFPTGQLVFSAPSAGQAVTLASFPRSDLVALSPSLPVRQCNNVAVDPAGHTALTVFSDRNLINPSADVDALAPGIQMPLTAAGLLGNVPLRTPSLQVEGETILYAEYFDASSGTVTAAGDTTFRLSADQQAPSVPWTIPGADCGAACLAPGDSLLFHFSEPMLTSTLGNSRVDLYSGTSCTGSATNVTSSAVRSYEAAARVLHVKPGSRAGSYAIRVQLPSTITDAASARNALPVLSRCVVFGTIGGASPAAAPQLAAAVPSTFTPDGDAADDTVTFRVVADAATSFLRLRMTRAGRTVWARLAPVATAGEYTFVWDGSDETGRIVRDGIYGYAVEAVNRSGSASLALRGFVEVDSAVRRVSVRSPQ